MYRKPYLELSRQGKWKRRQLKRETNNLVEVGNFNNGNADNHPLNFQNSELHCPFRSSIDPHLSNHAPEQRPSFPPENESYFHYLDDQPESDFSDGDEFYKKASESDKIKDSLRDWAIRFQISHVALTALLSIIRSSNCFFNLPSDSRTLLKTPSLVTVVPMEPGHYSHIGLEVCLKRIWQNVKETVSSIQLLIGIDGLPLFKNSCIELWPILGMVANVASLNSIVFPIGVYCGKGKPKSSTAFLQEFVNEIRNFQSFVVNGKSLSVSIKGFICDAPAKSYVLNVKGHTGYHSCTKCTQSGEWINHRMTFPDCDARKRTLESFIRQKDEDFHTGETVLSLIPGIDFIKSFPLDYMHLVCLGVVRTLTYLWIFGPVSTKLPSHVINSISSELIDLQKHIPLEFNRKPRTLDEVKRWKATEFRQFLLYTGPIVLRKVFKARYQSLYDHFLSLSISISILLSQKLCTDDNIEYAENLLKHFVKTSMTLYGQQYITHNMHGLTHLTESVKDFGSLDSSSAFPFENFLQFFKKIVRKGDKPLQQVVKRLDEMMSSSSWFSSSVMCDYDFPRFSKSHFNGPLLPNSDEGKQYSCIQFPTFTMTTEHPNSCCLLKCGNVVVIENVVLSRESEEMVILCREFLKKENFYSHPFVDSSALYVFLVSDLSSLHEYNVNDISGKMILLPFQDIQVAFPMLHCV